MNTLYFCDQPSDEKIEIILLMTKREFLFVLDKYCFYLINVHFVSIRSEHFYHVFLQLLWKFFCDFYLYFCS